MAEPFNGYKVHGIRFNTRTKGANDKTYSCSVVVKGTTTVDSSEVNYYVVMEELLKVEYFGEPIKCCILFWL